MRTIAGDLHESPQQFPKDFQIDSNAASESHHQTTSFIYVFGILRLIPTERILLKEGVPLALSTKTFDMLLVLIRNPGQLLTKARLLEELWPNTFVGEANLSTHIAKLRRVLGGSTTSERYIETVPKHGYRFVAPVRAVENIPSDVTLSGGFERDRRIKLLGSALLSGVSNGVDDPVVEENRAPLHSGTIIHDVSHREWLRLVAREAVPDSDVVVLTCRRMT